MCEFCITFTIPEGYEIEYLPEPVKIETEFGVYQSELKHSQNSILYMRRSVKNRGVFPPEKYADYVEFTRKVVDADSQKMILKKK